MKLLQAARRVAGSRSLLGASMIIAQPIALNAISLPVTAFIIASLGPLQYGSWAIALMLTTVATQLTNVGLRSLLVRTIARSPQDAPAAFAEHLGLRLLLTVIAGALVLCLIPLLGYPDVVWQCTLILCVGMLLSAAGNVVSDLLQGVERLPSLATINLVAGLTLTAASLVAMWLDAGPRGLAVAYLTGPLVAATASLVLVHRQLFHVRIAWNFTRFLELLKQCRHLSIPFLFGLTSNEAESFLVPRLVGISDFGLFAAGVLLPRRLMVIPDGLCTAFFPVLSRKLHARDGSARREIKKAALLMLLACVPPAVALVLLADPISRLLFPEHHESARLVLQLTAWALPVIGFESGMGYLLTAAGRERDEARIAIVRAIICTALSVGLIWNFGLVGACAALVAKGAVGISLRIPSIIGVLRDQTPSGLAASTPIAQPQVNA